MKFDPIDPPRVFLVGNAEKFPMHDCGRLRLAPDEQVTLTTESGAEYDVARKDWGFYATPSINGRLSSFGFKTALVKNPSGRFFVLLVEQDKMAEFNAYMVSEMLIHIAWLDNEADLEKLEEPTDVRG